MRIIIIEHEDPSLMCIHEKICDQLYEEDLIYVPIPLPKIIQLPQDIIFNEIEQSGISARNINIIDIKNAKRVLDAGVNVIIEGTFNKAINENINALADNHDCKRISLAINHPQKIINLSPVDDMVDVFSLKNEEIIQQVLSLITEKHKNRL
ncbi:MAG: hypothetical protein VX835_03875 [Pseudomonadota bacterium]|nr:hypothetical protein [Pseudomonadota bacterium]